MEGKKRMKQEMEEVRLVRILGKDIRGDKRLYEGLTKIKGISWSYVNAICKIMEIDKERKIEELSKEEISKIEGFVKDSKVPSFLKNRRHDFDDGEDKHLLGADLNLRKEFDVKRLKKIKSYRGSRHSNNLPVRGQRTRSNFRRNRKKSGAVGVKKKK